MPINLPNYYIYLMKKTIAKIPPVCEFGDQCQVNQLWEDVDMLHISTLSRCWPGLKECREKGSREDLVQTWTAV